MENLIKIGLLIKELRSKMAAKWIMFCVFFGLYVINRLRDGWANRAETWWNGRKHTRECPRKDFFLIFESKMAVKWII